MEISQKIGEATTVANKKTRMERTHGNDLFERAAAAANPKTLDRVLQARKDELTNDNKNGSSKIINESAHRMGVDITI